MAKAIITDQKKEEIRDAADIVDVVSDYVKLKKSGSSFTGLCPFHNEKTPSFNVTPRLGIFKCFGCGKGGDVFNFMMEIEGVGFVESMRTLAERYNIELPEEEQNPEYDARTQLTEGIYHALKFAGMYYHQQLMGEDESEHAREYLVKRGLKASTIKKFGLGFSPDKMDAFYQHATENGLNELYLEEAGLIKYSDKNQRPYDVFRGRLMFPIFSPSSKVIGFGGRVMKSDGGPKYINSPQTKVYNKSEVMYGIHLARNEIRRESQSILVEGYMDVISLWQHGVKNVVATSGTSVTKDQMRLLKNYADTMLMVYDADNAGQKAMIRGLDIALAQNLQVRLMHLPEGEDPDSFIQQFGAESFREYVNRESMDFITFMVNQAKEHNIWDDPFKKNKTINRILTSLSFVNDSVLRENLVEKLRKLSGVSSRALFDELGKQVEKAKYEQRREQERERNRQRIQKNDQNENPNAATGQLKSNDDYAAEKKARTRPGYEKEIIRLMLQYGEDMVYYIGNFISEDYFEDSDLKEFYIDIMQRYNDHQEISTHVYTAKEHPFPELVGEIMMEQHGISDKFNEQRRRKIQKDKNPYVTARGALKPIRIAYLEKMRDQTQQEMQLTSDPDKRAELTEKTTEIIKNLIQYKNTSSEKLFPDMEELEKQDADPDKA